MIATIVSGALERERTGDRLPTRMAVQNALASSLPPRAIGDGRRIYVSDADGMVIASAPRDAEKEDIPLTAILGETQPLTTFGARAGVLADRARRRHAGDWRGATISTAASARSRWSSRSPASMTTGAPTFR